MSFTCCFDGPVATLCGRDFVEQENGLVRDPVELLLVAERFRTIEMLDEGTAVSLPVWWTSKPPAVANQESNERARAARCEAALAP